MVARRLAEVGAIVGMVVATAVGELPDRQPETLPTDSVRTVPLGPPDGQAMGSPAVQNLMASLTRGMNYRRWSLRVHSVPESTDGVFWKITATPLEPDLQTDRPGEEMNYDDYARQIPVLRIPAHLWDSWLDSEYRDVVGIHYHDLQSFDAAHVFYTRYAHPPRPPETGGRAGKRVARIEGTLLLPVSWWLDQTIVIRGEDKKPLMDERIEHERGHAADALRDLVRTIAGPDSWDEAAGTGQKCNLVWRWRTEKLARCWDGIFGGKKPILTLRTYIDVLPPTRWSVLMNRPAVDVTDSDVVTLNDSLIRIDERYERNRAASTEAFHKKHGGYEGDDLPRFRHPGVGLNPNQ